MLHCNIEDPHYSTASPDHTFVVDHEPRAHYLRAMKNITFSADERTIELAREEARKRNTTLNQLFRDWIDDLAARDERRRKIGELFKKMEGYDLGGPYTREEMNRM